MGQELMNNYQHVESKRPFKTIQDDADCTILKQSTCLPSRINHLYDGAP